jgi:hypothetical protein
VMLPASVVSRYTKGRRIQALLTTVLILLSICVASPTAQAMNLPSTLVRMEVTNGTESHFNMNLSDLPSGYDVINGTYRGWCVDITGEMLRSPAFHEVRLYSSLNPPGQLTNERWDMVNYILNHKQGTPEDIQDAIWSFVNMNGGSSPITTVAWILRNDSLQHGNGFVPTYGQVIAVICFPVVLLPTPTRVQVTIIEVTVPQLAVDVMGSDGRPDGKVDMRDISYVARRFNCLPSDALWNSAADINGDGKIDMRDIGIVAKHFGEHYP